MRRSPRWVRWDDAEDMSPDALVPRVVDLVHGSLVWAPDSGCCDLCRAEAPLFRLLHTTDALCEGCFASWHG